MQLFLLDSLLQNGPVPPNWLPQNAVEILVLIVGAFMGFIFVFSSWKGSPTRDVELKKDPRVRSFLWGLTGFVAALLADWKPLLGKDGIDKSRLLVFYGLPFGIVGLLGVLAIALGLSLQAFWAKRRDPQNYPPPPFNPFLLYLYYGYQYYRQEYEGAVQRMRERRVGGFRNLSATAANSLAAAILGVGLYRKNPTEAHRKTVIKELLRHICIVVQANTQSAQVPDVNAALMLAVPWSTATDLQKRNLRFAWGDSSRYSHILVLMEYAYAEGQEDFALPVEDRARPEWEDNTLLGAPESFLRKSEIVVRTKDLDFAKSIPQNIQREIKQYFKRKRFKSFACLVVPGDGVVAGIVNVESEDENIFGSAEIQNEIAKILQPFCAALSLMLTGEG